MALTAQPTPRPIIGTQSRSQPVVRKAITAMTNSVSPALAGPASAGASAGTCLSWSKTMGMTVTAISMTTVPATVGVITWRSHSRRDAKRNCVSAERITKVASMAGPPWAMAVTETAMKAAEVPITTG